jgi:hypothetical protein
MSKEIPFRKIYVDSRYRTKDSVSSSNFKIELPVTTQMPENTVFFITDVSISNAWKTVEEGINDTLYIFRVNPNPLNPSQQYLGHLVRLASNNYNPSTLATELQTRLRENTGSQTFVVSVDSRSANSGITISNTDDNYQWKLLTDDDLTRSRYSLYNLTYDRNNLRSANDIINNIESNDIVIGGVGSSVSSWSSDFLNLNWINNLYLCSPNMGTFDTIFAGTGAGLGNNIIKKIPVTVNYGYRIVDYFMASNDFLDCSRATWQTLEFHLRTSKGVYVPLHNTNISFSIVINRYNPNI